MGYAEYLNGLLEPLVLYSTGGVSSAELDALGAVLDESFETIGKYEKESLVITAEDEGLCMYENILPYKPAYISAADRRRAILALARIDECSFTEAALNDAIAGCGIRASVCETGKMHEVEVSFPYNRGIPENIAELKAKIEEILPCHLEVTYRYIYTVWREIMEYFTSWRALEDAIDCWKLAEIYCREE